MTTPPGAGAGLFLVDTSVWALLPREPSLRARMAEVHNAGQVVLATPIVLELGFSAPSPAAWEHLHETLGAFPVLTAAEATHEIAVELQRALWHGGKVRAAGAFDTMIAACAVEHSATVLHYDQDFEHLASVEPRLMQEWIAPRGSIHS